MLKLVVNSPKYFINLKQNSIKKKQKHLLTVIKSPFVFKKARSQVSIYSYKTYLNFYFFSNNLISKNLIQVLLTSFFINKEYYFNKVTLLKVFKNSKF